MATFADDTAVMAIRETFDISTGKLQSAVNKLSSRYLDKKMANKTQRFQIGAYCLHKQED
jgi:hypothetical protein